MRNKTHAFTTLMILIFLGIIFQNCNFDNNSVTSNTITGNPFNTFIKFAQYQITSTKPTADESIANKPGLYELATANVSIKMCLNYVNLKYYPLETPDYADPNRITGMPIGKLVELQPSGTDIGAFSFKNGEYNRIEVNDGTLLECDEFPYGITMQVTNSHGTFRAYRGFQLEFNGDYTITGNGQLFELPIQKFVEAMAEVETEDSNCGQALCKSAERLIEYYELGWVSWAETDL